MIILEGGGGGGGGGGGCAIAPVPPRLPSSPPSIHDGRISVVYSTGYDDVTMHRRTYSTVASARYGTVVTSKHSCHTMFGVIFGC